MIRHWNLANFKAAHTASLEFAPLTIFTGTNSAGKSTIIQSILMTAQTLQNPSRETPILLNGALVKLGEFRDVMFRTSVRSEEQDSGQTDLDSIKVGFRLTANPHSGSSLEHDFEQPLERTEEYKGAVIGYEATAVECAYTFSAIEDENVSKAIRLYPLLQTASARLLFKKVGEWDEAFGNDSLPPERPNQLYRSDPSEYHSISTEQTHGLFSQERSSVEVFRVNQQSNLEVNLPDDFPKRQLKPSEQSALQYYMPNEPYRDSGLNTTFGAILSHFIPKGVYEYFDEAAREIDYFLMSFPHRGAQLLARPVKSEFPRTVSKRDKERSDLSWLNFWFSDLNLRVLTISIFREMIEKSSSGQYNKSRFRDPNPSLVMIKSRMVTIGEAVERLNIAFNIDNLNDLLILTHRLDTELLFLDHWNQRWEVLRQVLTPAHPPVYRVEELLIDRDLREGINFVERFFSTRVRYLGPLREEPKPLYPTSEGNAPHDVGPRGQHTAFVYHWHSDQVINYIPSIELEDPYGQATAFDTTLSLAVSDWLNYLGVVDELKATDRGRLGFEMQVAPDQNGSFFDLTQVGTGVSQVLPILVMCLLAPPGTTLILEQPELHLHPRVQTRLADFFTSMIWLGKQCIVETHSEHLINRLRYRVAVSEDEKDIDDTLLYFVEMEDRQAKYRPIRINKYGVIEDWPAGFFDESHALAADILRAGTAKRRRERRDD